MGSPTSRRKIQEMEEELKEKEELMMEFGMKEEKKEKKKRKYEEEFDEEDLEEKATLERLDTTQFDLELDKMIAKKLEEGKSEKEIIEEFFGKKSAKKEKRSDDYYAQKVPFLDLREAFGKNLQKPSEKEEQFQKRIETEVKNMEILNEILNESKDEPLSRYGRSDLARLGNKLTKEEKAEIEIKTAMLRSQAMVSEKPLPKNAEPTLIVKDRDVYEELDFQKEREEALQKTKASDLEEIKTQEKGMVDIAETKEEKRIRLKVESNLQSFKKSEDLVFKEGAKADLIESAKDMDIYFPEAKPGDRMIKRENTSSQPAIHQRVNKEAARIAKEFNFDLDYAKNLMKEYIFELKKLDEEKKKMEENLKKREKRKKLSKLMDELEEMDLEKELDYEEKVDVEEATRLNKLYRKRYLDVEDIEAIPEDELYGFGSEELNPIKGGKPYEIHRMRTQNNIEEYLTELFHSHKQTISVGVTKGVPIVLNEVILNPAITVVNAFWSALDSDMQPLEKKHRIVKELQKNLDNFAKFARGKMCRDLQFKFALELRFHYSATSEIFEDIVQNLETTKPSLIEERLKKEMELGNIKTKADFLKTMTIAEDDIESTYMSMMEKHTHEKIIKSKAKKLFDEEGKRIRNNRNEDGSRKKYKKQNKGDVFWNTL